MKKRLLPRSDMTLEKMVTYGLEARHTVVEAEASVHELKTPEESAAIWDEHRRKRAGRLSRCAAPNPSKRFPKPKVMGQKGPEKEETPKEQAVREKEQHEETLRLVQSFDMTPYMSLDQAMALSPWIVSTPLSQQATISPTMPKLCPTPGNRYTRAL